MLIWQLDGLRPRFSFSSRKVASSADRSTLEQETQEDDGFPNLERAPQHNQKEGAKQSGCSFRIHTEKERNVVKFWGANSRVKRGKRTQRQASKFSCTPLSEMSQHYFPSTSRQLGTFICIPFWPTRLWGKRPTRHVFIFIYQASTAASVRTVVHQLHQNRLGM